MQSFTSFAPKQVSIHLAARAQNSEREFGLCQSNTIFAPLKPTDADAESRAAAVGGSATQGWVRLAQE